MRGWVGLEGMERHTTGSDYWHQSIWQQNSTVRTKNFGIKSGIPVPFVPVGHHQEHWMSDTPRSDNNKTNSITVTTSSHFSKKNNKLVQCQPNTHYQILAICLSISHYMAVNSIIRIQKIYLKTVTLHHRNNNNETPSTIKIQPWSKCFAR